MTSVCDGKAVKFTRMPTSARRQSCRRALLVCVQLGQARSVVHRWCSYSVLVPAHRVSLPFESVAAAGRADFREASRSCISLCTERRPRPKSCYLCVTDMRSRLLRTWRQLQLVHALKLLLLLVAESLLVGMQAAIVNRRPMGARTSRGTDPELRARQERAR